MKPREKLRALIICGPTASGKSAIALGVAESLGGEIVNADSRQVYRGMRIGTGMPPETDFARVPHHLYGFYDPSRNYSAAQFLADAELAIAGICDRQKLAIVVGGTGFYVDALTGSMRLDRPPPDDVIRARLRNELRIHDSSVLWEWLAARRPSIAAAIRPSDPYRIIRGLETSMSEQSRCGAQHKLLAPLEFVLVRLTVSRDELQRRIDRRVREMFIAGLVREAVAIRGVAPSAYALTGIGYAEALAFWDGCATQSEAIARSIKRTEQYAKRQQTWFRHMRAAIVVDALHADDAARRIIALARERLVPA